MMTDTRRASAQRRKTHTVHEGNFRAVNLACHEFTANFVFAEHGLDPYFAVGRRERNDEISGSIDFRAGEERWQVTLQSTESGLVSPGSRLPTGTTWELPELHEYRLSVQRHPAEDPIGQQGFDAHIAPRWQGMKGEQSDGTVTEIPVPPDVDEGMNVKIWGANIEFDRYLDLLQFAAKAVGLPADYVSEPHEHSNVQDAEKYVRINKAASGPVHARDGPIRSLSHLLEHDRTGYRKWIRNDSNTRGEDLPGFYNSVTLDPHRVREAFPTHELPVEIKHYHSKDAVSLPIDDPLAHPKLGASYQVNCWEGKVGVTEEELANLEAELDRVVYSILADAGINLVPFSGTDGDEVGSDGRAPYVRDAYFDASVDEQSVEPVKLDLSRTRHEQESVVIRRISDGLSPVEWGSLETLVSNGGQVSPAHIAKQHGRHVESVRRALRRMTDLVDRDYTKVRLKSEHIAEMVHDAVKEARAGSQSAKETIDKTLDATERGLNQTKGTFVAWANHHGIDVDGARDARLILRFQEDNPLRERKRAIEEGLEIWTNAGLDPQKYRQAEIQFHDGGRGTAWRWLNA